jgi:hypothetical protein
MIAEPAATTTTHRQHITTAIITRTIMGRLLFDFILSLYGAAPGAFALA